ncbi:MAG: hypothetical protein K1V84_12020 [Muribaculaceae bacterium]
MAKVTYIIDIKKFLTVLLHGEGRFWIKRIGKIGPIGLIREGLIRLIWPIGSIGGR